MLELDADEDHGRRRRPRSGDGKAEAAARPTRLSPPSTVEERTAQNFFALPLLRMLVSLGGRAEAGTVLDELENELGDDLLAADLVALSSGETRWRKDVQWCRFKLVEEGYMSRARRGW